MNETIQIRFVDSHSDNLKSKACPEPRRRIENLKWLGLLERKRIVELAGKYRLPAIYPQKEFVDEGGLMLYGADYDDLYRRAAVYVDKILKGAKPADLPVQQATKFEFVINLKAAQQIGLTIPARVLERANKVLK